MPDLFVVLFLLVLALGAAVLSASWGIFFALLAIAYLAIRWNSQRGLEDERWKNTRLRLEALEAEVKRLASRTAVFRAEPAGAPEAEPAPEQPKSAAPQPPIATPPPSPKPVIEKPVAPPKPSVPPTPAAPEKIVVPAKPAPPTAKPFQPPVVAPPPPISAAPAQASARMTSQVAAPAGMAAPPKKSAGLEELIGTNWLPKLGVALIVGGLVSLLIYKWADLWPSAKLAVGFLSGAAMLGGGVFLERRERYQLFARSCIGGGWAMIFFTTFAMYHIGATRVLSSPIADLVLMIVVAAAMVLHTLKYRSQLATGFAFLLGYASIALNAVGPDGMNIGVPGLAASVILAAGLVTVVAREGWFELEVLGIVATYLNHWYWLRPIIEPMGGARHPFPEFLTSAVILCLYWAVFRGSYILRTVKTAEQESVSTVAALLNSFFFLGVMRYQSVHPELAFWFLLILGAVEIALGMLPITRRRRTAFVVLVTIGAALMVAAMPFRYADHPSRWAVLWLVEAEAFFLAGVFIREIIYRRLGLATALLVAIRVLVTQQYHAASNVHQAVIFGVAAVVFFADSLLVPRRWPELFDTALERLSLRMLTWVAAVMAFAGVWVALPDAWVAVGWAAVAVLLAVLAREFTASDLSLESHAFAAVAFIRLLAVNVELVGPSELNLRLMTMAAVAGLLYLCAGWSGLANGAGRRASRALHNTAASFLVALLVYLEAPDAWIVVAWIALCLAFTAVGRRFRLPELSFGAHVLALVALARALDVNFSIETQWHGLPLRLVTVVLFTAGMYAMAAWGELPDWPDSRRLRHVYTWASAVLVMALLWYELQPIGIAVGWMLFALVLFEVGMARDSAQLRWQGYFALAAAFARVFFANLNAAILPATYTVVPLAIAFFYVYARLDAPEAAAAGDRRFHIGGLQAYLGIITIVALLRFQLPAESVIVAWAALVLALTAAAWRLGRRIFLHQALLLTAVLVFRAVLLNLQIGSQEAGFHFHEVGYAVALLFVSLLFAFQLRDTSKLEGERTFLDAIRFFDRRPEQPLFFAPLFLLTVFLAAELQRAVVTVAWGLEGVAVFLVALWLGERSYRLSGLGLLMLCVGKILVQDVWRLQGVYRFLTLTVLGCALLLVSSLYIRYKEAFRRIL